MVWMRSGQPSKTRGREGGQARHERGRPRPGSGWTGTTTTIAQPPHLALAQRTEPLHLVFFGLTRLPGRRIVRQVD
jgi:hypothetical protein